MLCYALIISVIFALFIHVMALFFVSNLFGGISYRITSSSKVKRFYQMIASIFRLELTSERNEDDGATIEMKKERQRQRQTNQPDDEQKELKNV